MESKKSKIFTKKLIALFLAALMVMSTFTGVLSVFAKSVDDYHDSNLAANFLAWAETTDTQTAEALLDYADMYLPQIMEGLDLGSVKPKGSTRLYFGYTLNLGITKISIKIKGYLDSVDGVIELVRNASDLVDNYKGTIGGDVKNIDLSALNELEYTTDKDKVVSKCGVGFRSVNDAKDIILAVAKLLYANSNDYNGKNVLRQFLVGDFSLGLVNSFVNIYDLLGNALGMWDGYKSNIVYNVGAKLIFDNTDWFTQAEKDAFLQDFQNNGNNQTRWNYDDQLFNKLSTKLIQRINIQVTYPNRVVKIDLDPSSETYGQPVLDKEGNEQLEKDSSKRRWYYINLHMQEDKLSYEDAVAAVNANEGAAQGFECDPDLVYCMNEDGTSDGNILLFEYGDEILQVSKEDTITDIAFNALKIAWKSVLSPSLELLKIDYDANRNNSTIFNQEAKDFDNEFYSWKCKNGGWDEEDWTSNYSNENVEAWADAVYANYEYKKGVEKSAASFLEGVSQTFTFDRTRVEDPQNNWRDLDATKLYGELRYSPLADLYFDQQTGPINLYFVQTGAPNIEAFFDGAFTKYNSILEGLYDALLAAVKDFLPDSENIRMSENNIERPIFEENNTTDTDALAANLVSTAASIFEYVANTTDENILAAFYTKNAKNPLALNSVNESNFEEAILPLLISLVNQLSITDVIHNDEWDTCGDAEGVAVTVLAEYLSYVLPDKDYSSLYGLEDGKLVPKKDLNNDDTVDWLDDVIMPMARDALGYVIQSVVPCRQKDGTEWNVYNSDPTKDQTTIFDLFNSILCYYGSTDEFNNAKGSGPSTVKGKGAAAVIGCVDQNGKCTVTSSNDLWTNLDIIIDTLLPVVGALQTGTEGECDSKDLIYTKIIRGVLNVSENGGAITNILKQLIEIIKSAPLNTGIDVTVYDYIVAPTINALLGGKYEGQHNAYVIPPKASYYDSDSSSNTSASSPFNALVHIDTLGNYGYQSMGVLGILIANISEAFGLGGFSGKADDRWQGAMFAVKAVNNFIPSFVPQLSDMKFGPVTATIDTSSFAVDPNANIENALTIKNTSLGLNRFYRPDNDSSVVREPRYFADIKSADIYAYTYGEEEDSDLYLAEASYSGILSPGESKKIPILGVATDEEGTYLYKIVVVYNMYEAELVNGNKPEPSEYLFDSDITTVAYMTVTVGGSWQSVVYPEETAERDEDDEITKYLYNYDLEQNDPDTYYSTNWDLDDPSEDPNAVKNTTEGGKDGNLVASVPVNFVISAQDPSIADKFAIRVINQNDNARRSYAGVVAFASEGTQYYPVEGGEIAEELATVEDNESYQLAYALIDNKGNLINEQLKDYRVYDNGAWGEWVSGVTEDDLATMKNQDEETTGELYEAYTEGRLEERTHITYTIEQAIAAGIVTGVQGTANADGSFAYENVFVEPSAALVADSSADAISWKAPFDGFVMNNHGSTILDGSANYDVLFRNSGDVTASSEPTVTNLCFVVAEGDPMLATTNVYVVDQDDYYTLDSLYSSTLKKMASYRPIDFNDYNENTNTSASYDSILQALTAALKLAASPLSVESASKMSSVKVDVASTYATDSSIGEDAYKPATADEIPADILKNAYKKGNIYYINKECTIPIYSNQKLTADDVTNGKDAAGQAVTLSDEGDYYLVNDYRYEGYWDTTTYWKVVDGEKVGAPYYTYYTDAEHIEKTNKYSQIQFVYRDANGKSVNNDEDWAVKFAATNTVIKPNDANEYRGSYQQGIDTINYWNDMLSSLLRAEGAQQLANDVTKKRSEDSNSVNYDVAIYEKMVQVAKEAEQLYWYDGETPVTDKSSMEIQIALDRFEKYYDIADNNRRGYIGDKLNAEIAAHHAKGGTYEDFSVTNTGEQVRFEYSTKNDDEEDNVDVYTVKVTGNITPGFGTVDAEGNLVNADAEGNKIYSDASWAAYVNALGAAVETATEQTAKVSEIYTAKSHLVMAENNLAPYVEDQGGEVDENYYTVTGKITISDNRQGTSGKFGIGGISIMLGEQVLGESAEDGTFEISVPKGEPAVLTISGETTVDRQITINGDEDVANINIPIVICNYNKTDDAINLTDYGVFLRYMNTEYVYANLEASDNKVNLTDYGVFLRFMGSTNVVYNEWSQTTYVFE